MCLPYRLERGITMKCQNCGKEEVNFHYTSNINGNITERHLCAECASKLGLTGKMGIGPDASFEDIFAELFGARPNKRMFGGYGMVLPTFVIPAMGLLVPDDGPVSVPAEPELRTETKQDVKPEIDEEMKKRRELNILREQMRIAVEKEEFEKAAVLRDSIRALEG